MKNYIKNMSKKDLVLLNIRKMYDSYGYKKISLPSFEEYDLYNENKDFIDRNVLTVMSPNGKLLALRPDITLSVAKKVSKDQSLKYSKIYYQENTYNLTKYVGYEEDEQLGIELIGKESTFLDFEIINLAVKSLDIINKKSMIVLSHAGFISSIFENFDLEYEVKEQIFDCINRKNSHDIEKILENNKNVSENVKKLIYKIPELSGNLENIEKELLKYEINENTKKILFELKQLNNLLLKFHKKSKIIFDFSIVKNLNYYNGIILQGYIEDFPNVILTGGRYDKLFEKFGVDTGAVGFAILTDGLKGYYKDENKNDFEVLIVYDNSDFEKLVEIINDFQKKGLRVRTENIENLGESDFEIFNFDEKYIFQNGELKKEE
ncbi:ATP phosphoribosyltransferase regulatory subunit [Leptotrichia buccalis]|uniref:tRNA synthetase class II (G H P and S) n=1 Tax=Leptotrichia buccalis (strain ATCC 14201 / DSM 1135 / JCM 12969 / NCTC 10249 / C-1013-b) TaxID=523794 RepID=C7NAE9_LEPBD|nr:ATP phosphoribosyltransferase regulatory subunit [Leptotrichia buccalis]ACV39130.1 tRNA synthetase class II (G H P and S) [Leptotrichia buccalis C-1013-b]